MTKCERVLSLAPDMGLRAYEQELHETFVQTILSEAETEDLLSILLWEDCNDGFYILSSTGVNVENLTQKCIAFLSFVARHVIHHKKSTCLA